MEKIEKANFLHRGFILVLLTCTCMVLADYIDNDVSCPMAISCPSIKAPGSDDVIQLVKKKVPRGHPMAIPQQMKGIDLNIVCSIPACLSNPCLHGGTCNETNDGYECHCLFSFTGKRCQACLVSSNEMEEPASCCSDGLGLNYTIPMFHECKKELHPNGSWVQKIPKIIPYTAEEAACPRRKSKLGIPPGHRVCRFPYCIKDRCKNGWCEETMKGYKCHCSRGYRGSDCSSQSTSTQDDTTTTTTTTLSPTAADSESTSTQDDTTTTTTRLSPTAANSESTYTQDDTTTTTTTLSPTAANSESTSTQDDTTTTTATTLSPTAADSESTSTQDDTTTTTTTTLSPTAADSESTSTQDDTTTTTTTLSTTATSSDEDITTEGSTNSQFPPDSPGWKCTSSKCYRLYDEQERDWSDAKAFCSGLDPVNTTYGYRPPSLLFLNTEEEAREIIALQLGLTDVMLVWINCNDLATEGDFVCDVDGNGTPPSSSWWKQGEPSNQNPGHDCVAVKRGWSELLKWRDVSCSWSLNRYTMCQYIVGQPEQ